MVLQHAGPHQHDQLGEFHCRFGGDDGLVEAVRDKTWHKARVIEMGMRDDHRVDRGRIDGELGPVQLAQLLLTLEQAAVDQDPGLGGLDQELGAGHRAGGTKETDE